MSGFFVVGEKKERPGVYKRYENAGGVEAAGARSGVGCALVTGNWGALNTPVTIDQSTDISNVIGAGSGYDAITAFMAGGMEECVGEYDISADDLLSGDNRGQKIHEAKEFLKEILVSGSVAQTKVAEEAESRGIKKKTLWNAKKELEIESVKIGNQWFWMLPE